MKSAGAGDELLSDGRPQVAFAGRSNVGKSSLLNRLLGRKGLARISSTPGRTRTVNYFLINDRFYFVDLPGYGYAKVEKRMRRDWGELIDAYLRQALPEANIVQLVDAKVGATPLDLQAFEYLQGMEGLPMVVATKIDRVARSQRSAGLTRIREALTADTGVTLIPFSARSGEGVRELWKEIETRLQTGAKSEQ